MKFRLPFVSLILSPILALQPLVASPASAVSGDVSQTPSLHVSADAADGALPPGGHSKKGFVIHISDEAGVPVADAAVLLRLPETGVTGTFSDATHASVGYTDAAGNVQLSGIQWSAEAGVVPIIVTATKGVAHAGVILEQHLDSSVVAAPTPPFMKPAVAAEPTSPKAILPAAIQPGPIAAYVPTVESNRPAVIAPSVSVVNAPTHQHFDSGASHKKWIILAVVAAAAAGSAFALMGKKSSSSSSTPTGTTTTIGAPTITVGAP